MNKGRMRSKGRRQGDKEGDGGEDRSTQGQTDGVTVAEVCIALHGGAGNVSGGFPPPQDTHRTHTHMLPRTHTRTNHEVRVVEVTVSFSS